MGELIRNIKEITLGREKYMIEENEGYTAQQGRIIHIQNDKFRLVLSEKDFYDLSTIILRSEEEMTYYKSSEAEKRKNKERGIHKECTDEDIANVLSFSKLLEGVDYRVVETGYKYATIIIAPKDRDAFIKRMESHSEYEKLYHPYGKNYGYSFLYQMNEFELYKKGDFLIEVVYQLPCLSLTPKKWIPLDKIVQKRVWDYSKNEKGFLEIDTYAYLIYRLGFSVFFNEYFTDYDKKLFDDNLEVVNSGEFKTLLDMVFFKFSKTLIEMINQKDYDNIIPDFFTFNKY